MENYFYQKWYFQYLHDEYPNLTFNNIEYKIISQFNIKEIKYSLKDFNNYKRKKFKKININENNKKIQIQLS